MKARAYIIRACLWSLVVYALWEWLQPLSSRVLAGLANGILRFSGHPAEIEVKRANRGAVLFLALYLGHPRAWRESARAAGIGIAVGTGIAACLLSEALAIATLAAVPTHQGLAERLLRSLAVGIDKATPLVAWLYLARREIFPWIAAGRLAGAGPASRGRRKR